jgi:transposase-like protein
MGHVFVMDQESLELLLRRGSTIAEIARRVGKAPSTVANWLDRYGLEPVHRATHGRGGSFDRDQLVALVDSAMTVAAIAAELGVTVVTARRHLARAGLRTARTRRLETGATAKEAGRLTTTLHCGRHGETAFVLEGCVFYRCKRCRSDRVARRRRAVKAILAAEAGGCCAVCGYARYLGALEFHHLDPNEKRFEINTTGATMSIGALRVEAKSAFFCAPTAMRRWKTA